MSCDIARLIIYMKKVSSRVGVLQIMSVFVSFPILLLSGRAHNVLFVLDIGTLNSSGSFSPQLLVLQDLSVSFRDRVLIGVAFVHLF